MAQLIFLFFAAGTDILNGADLFTDTIERMANADGPIWMHAVNSILAPVAAKNRSRLQVSHFPRTFCWVIAATSGLWHNRCNISERKSLGHD
ncbi:MAG: hypothetical protein N4A61_00420 [Pelagimonas sp.]|nr:hypothetical protein [Pelagimonas sp.]